MSFAKNILNQDRPTGLRKFSLPRRQSYLPSPADWRDEVLYFLLPDRFSDGQETQRPLLDRKNLNAARPKLANGESWRFDRWAQSGADRWQGGTIRGITSKLSYLKNLGITTIWVGPIFKQRGHLDTYHGYGIQDFLDVDPRFGNRNDLVKLVEAAHAEGLRIILDIIFNHSGSNWLYPEGTPGGALTPVFTRSRYPFGHWRGDLGQAIQRDLQIAPLESEEGVWPTELQNQEFYTRDGKGNLGAGDIDDPNAELRLTDFEDLRDFQLDFPGALDDLARCYKYWIALTDCDGFRIDTLKHVSQEQARNFCGTIKEFASNLGKKDFFLVGEIAGGDFNENRYLDVLAQNLNAALDIGEMRLTLTDVAKGLIDPRQYFEGFDPGNAVMGSHRNLGRRHVSILDDHDHVFGQKIRFSTGASSEHQVVVGVALQLFTLGIPCVYYGTEQAFAGPEPSVWQFLPDFKGSDRYLREAMFGPTHPRKQGRDGLKDELDQELPGFGPFGTVGHHCFDQENPVYTRIAILAVLRKQYPVLRYGRQYLRQISFLGKPFDIYGSGEIVAWSRILDDEEVLCVINLHGTESRGAQITVDANLNPPSSFMTVIANTFQVANSGLAGTHPVKSKVSVERTPDGKRAFVAIQDIQPSEILILTNHPEADEGGILP